MKKKLFWYLLIAILCLPAIWSLLKPGFFPSQDGEWMVVRLSDFHRSLVSGQVPVRWAARLNHGYGYPVFNFLYPLSLYLGEAFYLFLGSFVAATKAVFIFSFIASGWAMYLYSSQRWGRWSGLVAAAVYVYTPYRFLDVYVRGSLGEALAFVFVPLIFFSIDRLGREKDLRFIVFGGLAWAALITAHNTLAMLFSVLIGLYLLGCWLVAGKKNHLFISGFYQLLLSLGLSAFFWLPALYDRQFVWFSQAAVSDFYEHFPSIRQLLIPDWSFEPSLPGVQENEMSYQLGLFNLVVVIGFLTVAIMLYRSRKINRLWLKDKWPLPFWTLVFLLSGLLMLPISEPVWKLLSVDKLIQFPWRLLSLTTFASAFIAGGLVGLVRKRARLWLVPAAVIVLLFLNFNYLGPREFIDRGEGYYSTNEGTTTVANEYLPVWVSRPPLSRAGQKVEITAGEGVVSRLDYDSRSVNFRLSATTAAQLRVNTHYFPGWSGEFDRRLLAVKPEGEKGLIGFELPPGEFQIKLVLKETPLRRLANLISCVSFGLILVSLTGISLWSKIKLGKKN